MNPYHINSVRERLILAITAVVTYLISSRYDILEKLVAFAHRHEGYELDELVMVCLVLVVCQAILLYRRWLALSRGKSLLTRRNRELEEALAEIRQLKGILPICSSCKKIRDDEGYWHQVEAYISSRSDAQFSHSICPSCASELYGDFLDRPPKDNSPKP